MENKEKFPVRVCLSVLDDFRKQNDWINQHSRRKELKNIPKLNGDFFECAMSDIERAIKKQYGSSDCHENSLKLGD